MPLLNAAPLRRRRAPATVAMVLYLGLALAAPLAHARTEVLSSRPEVESQHTKLCVRIHAEATCLVGLSLRALAPSPRVLPTAGRERNTPTGLPREAPAVRPKASSRHLVRAPPAS